MEIYGGKGDVSLRIWLPMIKDLRQQGLSNVTVTNNGAIFNSAGKLGGTYSATASGRTITIDFANLSTMLANGKTYTLTCWVKPTGTPSNGWVIKLGNNNCGLWWAKSEARWVWNENDDGKRCANPTISADYTNWHHLAIVVDKTSSGKITTRQYVDGTLANGYPGSTWDNSSHSQPAGTIITISPYVSQLNDIRLYDHCLSPMEVKELSKGLVLHYPLNRGGWGQENLLENTNGESVATSANDSAYPAPTRYLTDTGVEVFTNTEDDFTYSCNYEVTNNSAIGAYIYTQAKGTTAGGSLSVYNTPIGRYTHTFKLNDTQAASTNHYCRVRLRNASDGAIIKVWNQKLEKGSIATPWSPASTDTLATTLGLNDMVEYDTSGYCNNLTKNGTYSYTSDTPKYAVSTTFNGTEWMNGSTPGAEIKTLACWAKTTKNKSTSQFMVADSTSAIAIAFYSGCIIGVFGSTRSTGSKCTLGSSYKENDWNHFVVVKTGDAGERAIYCNGELLTPTSNDYWGSATGLFIGSRNNSGALPFYGQICDVRAYATALSADDVKSLYQNSAYIDSSGNVYGAVHEED